jgi:hypothetical protein
MIYQENTFTFYFFLNMFLNASHCLALLKTFLMKILLNFVINIFKSNKQKCSLTPAHSPLLEHGCIPSLHKLSLGIAQISKNLTPP